MKVIINFIKKLLRKSRVKKSSPDAKYIIPRDHHTISKTDISTYSLKVVNRINSAGFEAYLVGGSIRDLLIGKAPKDFDVATSATPNQVKTLFRNARIIGRRFKLVHVFFQREVIEVATFRSVHQMQTENSDHKFNPQGMLVRDNVFGSLEEDAWRRDFTVNSLYYNPEDSTIVDFTGGVSDIKARIIRIIGDPLVRYQEDPVRMLRAIRFCAKLNFNLSEETAAPLAKLAPLLSHISSARLFDELVKLYQCANAKKAHSLMVQYKLFEVIFEQIAELFGSNFPVKEFIEIALENTDARIKENKPVTASFLFAVFLWFPMLNSANYFKKSGMDPLPALEKAMSYVISKQSQCTAIPRRFGQMIREIWLIQYRFAKRTGRRAFHILHHPRFRAAYDFLLLRALAGDESLELAKWWTTFQEVSEKEQERMVQELEEVVPKSKKRRHKKRRPKHD